MSEVPGATMNVMGREMKYRKSLLGVNLVIVVEIL